jgi:hypothetical protein
MVRGPLFDRPAAGTGWHRICCIIPISVRPVEGSDGSGYGVQGAKPTSALFHAVSTRAVSAERAVGAPTSESSSALRNFMLLLRDGGTVVDRLREARLERAIGVIYRPETERWSHYFHARLPDQFDAIIHIDETRAVEPLERTAGWERGDLPETFPSGK